MNVRPNQKRAAGFTLIELSIVILIIGIMTTFLLVASYEGVQRSNEQATRALVLKLDTALSDRIDALASLTPPVTTAHRDLAQVVVPGATVRRLPSDERALTIARLDFLRAELPDVFFVQADADYPLNFAGQSYNPNGTGGNVLLKYVLPLGVGLAGESVQIGDFDAVTNPPTPYNLIDGRPQISGSLAGRGIFGASYGIAAGLYKQLGYAPRGCNGIDDNGNSFIDERSEGNFGLTAQERANIDLRLLNHKHETARSEMLYAILVEGQGPLGSYFTIDDFRPNEVGDTDQDGLMEFVDAWGKPLQFFRWPIYFVSDVASGHTYQRGLALYTNSTESREQNPLDSNQELMTPSWWANLATVGSGTLTSAMMSPRARLVHQHFVGLLDPMADILYPNIASLPVGGTSQVWDRTGFYKRRAFYSKFLIASAGPDGNMGIGRFGVDFSALGTAGSPYGVNVPVPVPVADRDVASFQLTAIESQAGRTDPVFRASTATLGTTSAANAGVAGLYQGYAGGDANVNGGLVNSWATDDVTNQTLGSASTGVR